MPTHSEGILLFGAYNNDIYLPGLELIDDIKRSGYGFVANLYPDSDDPHVLNGQMHDHFGFSNIRNVTITDTNLIFAKTYGGRMSDILYELRKAPNDEWYVGIWIEYEKIGSSNVIGNGIAVCQVQSELKLIQLMSSAL